MLRSSQQADKRENSIEISIYKSLLNRKLVRTFSLSTIPKARQNVKKFPARVTSQSVLRLLSVLIPVFFSIVELVFE